MHFTLQQARDSGIHESMTLQKAQAPKALGADLDPIVAAFPRAWVSGVSGAVVVNQQAFRLQRLPQQGLDLVYDSGHGAVFTSVRAH
ncbi:MAG TPA: hypothetical protein VGO41_00155 [Steroidobacteraceae bacterium]|jgi:hypothetical protein|nr:hypothetical protein [Steroidobacteraceae bacterium]